MIANHLLFAMRSVTFSIVEVTIMVLVFSGVSFSQVSFEREVHDFMKTSETLFKEMKVNEIAASLSGDFQYDFLTKVDGKAYDEKLNYQSYTNYLRLFFQRNPIIEEYKTNVQKISISNEQAILEFTIVSSIAFDGLSQRCEGAGSATLEKYDDSLRLASVKGMSQCTNFQSK